MDADPRLWQRFVKFNTDNAFASVLYHNVAFCKGKEIRLQRSFVSHKDKSSRLCSLEYSRLETQKEKKNVSGLGHKLIF